MAILIDALRREGLDALGECYLGRRQNRHQPLRALGEMAYAVLAAVERRLDRGTVVAGAYLRPWDDGAVAAVPVLERSPLKSLDYEASGSGWGSGTGTEGSVSGWTGVAGSCGAGTVAGSSGSAGVPGSGSIGVTGA